MPRPVRVTIDGGPEGMRSITLLVDYNAMCDAEEVSGLNYLGGDAWLSSRGLRALVWAAANRQRQLDNEPPYALEKVGAFIGHAGVDRVMNATVDAWSRTLPQPEDTPDAMQEEIQRAAVKEAAEGDPLAEANTTPAGGSGSGRSPESISGSPTPSSGASTPAGSTSSS